MCGTKYGPNAGHDFGGMTLSDSHIFSQFLATRIYNIAMISLIKNMLLVKRVDVY